MRHILAVEAVSTDGWLPPEQLVAALEAYRANYSNDGRPRSGAIGLAPRVQNKPNIRPPVPPVNELANAGTNTTAPRGFPGPAAAPNTVQRCYVCDSPFYKAKQCPQRVQGPGQTQVRPPVRAPPPTAASRVPKPASVNRCKTDNVTVDVTVDNVCHGVKPTLFTALGSVAHSPVNVEYWPDSYDIQDDAKTMETSTMNVNCDDDVFVLNTDSTSVSNVDGINALDYMPIKIRGVSGIVNGLIDSGSMICVVNSRIVSGLNLPHVG